MKVAISSVVDILSRWRIYFQTDSLTRSYGGEEPLRSELYSMDQMERHGRILAAAHQLQKRPSPDRLLKRLDENEKKLLEARNLLIEDLQSGQTLMPAAEWLLDNFYLIEEQVVIARKHLPKGYSEGLPCLANGHAAGHPRVYDIALEIIAHSDGWVDVSSLASFIAAYQSHTLLTLGELWAIPIMLRLAAIENLRRISGRVALDMIDHNLATYWTDKLILTARKEPRNLILTVAEMAKAKPVLSSVFVAGFKQQLQGVNTLMTLPLNWLEQQLSEPGLSSADLIREENRKQAVNQVSVRNCIGTLRLLGVTDWRQFVENLSSVEKVLSTDPSGTYSSMDFATRDSYRHAVESISKSCPLSETEVAQQVIGLAQQAAGTAVSEKERHVGYYLIGKGLKQTRTRTGMHRSLPGRCRRMAGRHPFVIYLTSILLLTLFTASGMWWIAFRFGSHNWTLLLFTAFILAAAMAQLSISFFNWLATVLARPHSLPRMDFSKGIPAESQTLVVIPSMLSGKATINRLAEKLEIYFLANQDANLSFGLLTDFTDAALPDLPDDSELVTLASNHIHALNLHYPRPEKDIFFLFHRPRKWNASEQKWMGYERKRGKLAALNALIRGHGEKEFSRIVGSHEMLANIKYIVTLDADTQLPRESVWKLTAAMAHPLNHPYYHPGKKRVTDGYGILQPRVAPAMPETLITPYLNLQGNAAGIDPYTRVHSDMYQDIFREGSFIGKGIYDVDIFEQAVRGHFPENRILSHDLLEGCYARSGLLSDVVLYEENPAQYEADVNRHYRWVRGDWQIGAWILPFVRNSRGQWTVNRLSSLSKWKIFDNLRRSMLPLTYLALLLVGWTLLPFPWLWTLAMIVVHLLPPFIAFLWQLVHRPLGIPFKIHFYTVTDAVKHTLLQFIFNLAVLPYEAIQYTGAAILTLGRLGISKKRLLEWRTSAEVSSGQTNNLRTFWVRMWPAPLLAALTAALLCFYVPVPNGYWQIPILCLWLCAPALAWWVSNPEEEIVAELTESQVMFLQRCARKTWSFFEQFLTAEDNWLPPDNYQEQPVARIAHRTSPTNMGLALLANLAAYDFGYIPGSELLSRCSKTLKSMAGLERYKGHFYNWYDTQSLLPLPPRYVSAVDSGNLAGHLLTLRQGLLALPRSAICHTRLLQGLRTTLQFILKDTYQSHPGITVHINALLNNADNLQHSLGSVTKHLTELSGQVSLLTEKLGEKETEATIWTARLLQQVNTLRDGLVSLAPWAELLPVPASLPHLAGLDNIPTLEGIPAIVDKYLPWIAHYEQQPVTRQETEWLQSLRSTLHTAHTTAIETLQLTALLAGQCEQFSTMDYGILLNTSTNLFAIGYNVEDQKRDKSYYDLLASEARLGIFVGIAQGSLPLETWFTMGRQLTRTGSNPVLLSWSGTMFEYLMPQLVMPSYKNTLLYQTADATVSRQIEYAIQQGVPWGISESAYNQLDVNLNYQYRAFGVPGLGLRRGLEDDLVIAPYASMLALMVDPVKACDNLRRMASAGFEGTYGFYEAIDYTAGRRPKGKDYGIIPSFMVHHQGMGLLSLAYLLLDKPMQRRFVAELRFQATLLLLQEQIPKAGLYYVHAEDNTGYRKPKPEIQARIVTTLGTAMPEIGILGNERYQVMISDAGGGYSRWQDIAITRWREDATLDNCGIFCYIQDKESGHFWSNTYQPTLQKPKSYSTQFSQGMIEFSRHDDGIDTHTEIVVSAEDDTEKRRIRLINKSRAARTLEITSYAEIVLNRQAADEAHPAFSNLFVQTEILPGAKAILCTRRPRSQEETPPWMFHLMEIQDSQTVAAITYETDRMAFIGRGRTTSRPAAMENHLLSGHQGPVLDPIMAIRYRIVLKPGQKVSFDLIYGIADTREACEGLLHKYQDRHLKNRAFELSWTHTQVQLRHLNMKEADAQLYDRLAAYVIYPDAALRTAPEVIRHNNRGQSGLWGHSISGDLPILLLQLSDPGEMDLLRQMVQAHRYWQMKGLATDLVIFNEVHGSYRQDLQDQIQDIIASENGRVPGNKPGNIYLKSAAQISPEDRILFETVARMVIRGKNGSLEAQLNSSKKTKPSQLQMIFAADPGPFSYKALPPLTLPEDLLFFNGSGGFAPDGNTYKILTDRAKKTPAPWVNVLANAGFGTVVSESGSAYTWAANAHEYRLTPWNNDPVGDSGGEAFYIRDEDTGHFWSPVPFPATGATPYITTHGFGYSSFEHMEEGLHSEMCVFVDKDLPIKFVVIKVKNLSGQERNLSVTGFMEIILGDLRAKTSMHVLSEKDSRSATLLFQNKYNTAFAEQVSFFGVNNALASYTADRAAFIGRNGNLQQPLSIFQKKLSSSCGAGLDPCAALRVSTKLLNGEEKEIIFQIGSAASTAAASELIQTFATAEAVSRSLADLRQYWATLLQTVQVHTPDPALDILTNGWLLYQTLACRIFARSGFYQSGGAFGFRDQLQDVLALLHAQPQLARRQVLLHASRQFVEGDVQHWWHPPEGRGVRTHCSDDLLWLPYTVCAYVTATCDEAILSEETGFLESRLLQPEEDSSYDLPVNSTQQGTLYEHCTRAIRHSLRSMGVHGLPLIGSGDWNDGMDKVGNKGRGESVWLAFFLYDILVKFAPTALRMGDHVFANTCTAEARRLQSCIEASGWDGNWYLRAWFDDSTPLGSAANQDCRIDAIAQSWSVLSGAGDPARSKTAMEAVSQYLVHKDMRLMALLAPPFDGNGANPGYIQGYVPGIRENGGQYTHAAVWSLMALARTGDRAKTWELFNMINPIRHASDAAGVQRYKAEPYVMAADVYASDSHKGRGGWTWYTGSAGWMYQFITGSMLGMHREGSTLVFQPCFPVEWPSITVDYRYHASVYHITVLQLSDTALSRWEMDTQTGTGNRIALMDDAHQHTVSVFIGLLPGNG